MLLGTEGPTGDKAVVPEDAYPCPLYEKEESLTKLQSGDPQILSRETIQLFTNTPTITVV